MPSLTLIASEAKRLLSQIKEPRRSELQQELVELCEQHWQELRGPEPDTPLAQVLWSITPPWSDLLLDLCAKGDWRFAVLLPSNQLSKALALVVLAEIERGNEAGVHIAHEPMMAFESIAPPQAWLERLSTLLRGTLDPPLLHKHNSRDAVWKALAVIAAQTKRLDLPAVIEVINLLGSTEGQPALARDEALAALRQEVLEVGIRFLGIEDDYVQFELHGHAHKPIRTRQLGEMLLEIRQKWLH